MKPARATTPKTNNPTKRVTAKISNILIEVTPEHCVCRYQRRSVGGIDSASGSSSCQSLKATMPWPVLWAKEIRLKCRLVRSADALLVCAAELVHAAQCSFSEWLLEMISAMI